MSIADDKLDGLDGYTSTADDKSDRVKYISGNMEEYKDADHFSEDSYNETILYNINNEPILDAFGCRIRMPRDNDPNDVDDTGAKGEAKIANPTGEVRQPNNLPLSQRDNLCVNADGSFFSVNAAGGQIPYLDNNGDRVYAKKEDDGSEVSKKNDDEAANGNMTKDNEEKNAKTKMSIKET